MSSQMVQIVQQVQATHAAGFLCLGLGRMYRYNVYICIYIYTYI